MLEDDQGAHPNLIVVGYFLFLITAMVFNLYFFHHFQQHQEEMAARIEDVQFSKQRKIVVETKDD